MRSRASATAMFIALSACFVGCAEGERIRSPHPGDDAGAVDSGTQDSAIPPPETCGDELDNDHDSRIDEGCAVCESGETDACYEGPAGTAGVGQCRAGSRACEVEVEFGATWGACSGSILPGEETCADTIDGDCDGFVDEGCTTCTAGETMSCYGGPAGTEGVGRCAAGMRTCRADGSSFGECMNAVLPIQEVCGNSIDEDCDGTPDDGCSTPEPTGKCWGTPFMHELCRPIDPVCPWAICKSETEPVGSACPGGNASIDGMWGETCDSCRTPPCRMYRTTVQNCSEANCR